MSASIAIAPGAGEGESLTEESFPNAVFGSAPRRRKNSNPHANPTLDTSSPTLSRMPAMQSTPPKVPSRSPARPPSATRRPDSPDLQTMMANTPRPRRKSSASFTPTSAGLRSRSRSMMSGRSRRSSTAGQSPDNRSVSDYGALLEETDRVDTDEESSLGKVVEDEGSESDSSIDLHTPLPHLMFRDGLLSPRSKLFPHGSSPFALEDAGEDPDFDRSRNVLSVVSTVGSLKTKSGFLRDPRDTDRRRNRHRDGRLLRAGMGLTTGLGWSDSEDEDAPSTLTRRLIQTSIARIPSLSSPTSSRPTSLTTGELTASSPPLRSPQPRPPFLRKIPLVRSASTSFSWVRPEPNDSPPRAEPPRSEPKTMRSRTQSSASVSTVSTISHYSTASSSASPTPSIRRPMKLPRSGDMQAGIARKRAESAASTSSIPPPSTASTSSTSTIGSIASVPRPLRLPQSTSLSNLAQARFRRSATVSSALVNPRTRTLSSSQAASASTSFAPRPLKSVLSAQKPVPVPMFSRVPDVTRVPDVERSAPTPSQSQPASRSVSPVSASALSSPPSPTPRPRPLVAGPRPKPRTGTGMVYHTGSSYSSLQETTLRMRAISMASTSDARVVI